MAKRVIGLFLCMLALLPVLAQTQQGIVKTRGRMVNGVLQSGKGIEGATVQVKDRSAVVSGANGRFSFPLRTNTYMMQSVKKQGYQLVDYSVCTEYKYSENPLRLVMETSDQLRRDQLAAERKIRENLKRQLEQKENEIEALHASQQEKDSLLFILYQKQSDNEKLISDMAKRYSTLDYDQLDEFYRQVSWFIENGELTRADSLLRTRGDINAQVQDILRQGKNIREQKEQIRKAEAVHRVDIDEAARRCFSYYEAFFAQHQNDSAAHYLELRTQLDTTNINWLNDWGIFIFDYLGDVSKAYEIFKKERNQAVAIYGEVSEEAINAGISELSVRTLLLKESISGYYGEEKEKVDDDFEHLLKICEQVYGTKSSQLALAYNNFGSVMLKNGLIDEANELYAKAIEICGSQIKSNDIMVLSVLNNIASAYYENGYYENAFYSLKDVIEKGKEYLDNNQPITATLYNNFANAAHKTHHDDESLFYHQKAIDIREKIYDHKHPLIADSYNNLGTTQIKLKRYEQAMGSFNKAQSILSQADDGDHFSKAIIYNNIGLLYIDRKEFPKAVENFEKALELIGTKTVKGAKTTALFYNNIAFAYFGLSDYHSAIKAFERSMELSEKEKGNEKTAIKAYNIASLHYINKDFAKVSTYNSIIMEGVYGLTGDYQGMMRDFFYKTFEQFALYGSMGTAAIPRGNDGAANAVYLNHNTISYDELYKDISKTEEYYLKLIKKWTESRSNDVELAIAYINLADYYLTVQFDETNAKVNYEKAKGVLSKTARNHILSAKSLLGLALCDKNSNDSLNYDYVQSAISIMESHFGTDNEVVIMYKEFLSELLNPNKDDWNNSEEPSGLPDEVVPIYE